MAVKSLLLFIATATACAQFGVTLPAVAPRAIIPPSAVFTHIDSTGLDSTAVPGGYQLSYDAFGVGWVSQSGDLHYVARRGREHVDVTGFVSQWKSTDDGATWSRTTLYDSASVDDRNIAGGRDAATNRVVVFWEGYPALTTSYKVSADGGADREAVDLPGWVSDVPLPGACASSAR